VPAVRGGSKVSKAGLIGRFGNQYCEFVTMLSEIAPELWIAEQRLRYLGFEVGRRMTVIRLVGGGLLIHSPARLSTGLRAAL
jgi:hypothetical protein